MSKYTYDLRVDTVPPPPLPPPKSPILRLTLSSWQVSACTNPVKDDSLACHQHTLGDFKVTSSRDFSFEGLFTSLFFWESRLFSSLLAVSDVRCVSNLSWLILAPLPYTCIKPWKLHGFKKRAKVLTNVAEKTDNIIYLSHSLGSFTIIFSRWQCSTTC